MSLLLEPEDHLVCFLGGAFLLGITEGQPGVGLNRPLSDQEADDLFVGKGLIKTCVDTYQGTKTGLGSEIVHFGAELPPDHPKDWFIKRSVYVSCSSPA